MKLKKLKICKIVLFFSLIILSMHPLNSFSCSFNVLPKKVLIILNKITSEKSHFVVEIAKTDEQKKQGLQCRISLKKNEGMLFVWNSEDYRTFWMKNTRIPLDLIFVNANYEIVDVFYNAEPYKLNAINSKKKAKYVLELNSGVFKSFYLNLGDKILLKK